MPTPLLDRIGPDTPGKLERAAARRYAEAVRLKDYEPLGALYLFGYAIEMRLKSAWYRLTNVPQKRDINVAMPNQSTSPRQLAEQTIRVLLNLPAKAPVGHSLIGWAKLVIETRRNHALGPLQPADERALWEHAQKAARVWRETLRYRANKPYNQEVEDVAAAANWVRRKYRTLWT
ncbi:MAG TPA: hypothetical protein VGM03_19520 [Phycisphaerae bacterium]|jgi:hypothetical protein